MICRSCASTLSKLSGCTRARFCMARSRNYSRPNAWRRFLNWRSVKLETLRHILSPDFLLRNSVYTSVLIGFACPLVGVFLVLRRLVFMGVALPQISSTGVAIALSVPLWLGAIQPEHAAQSEHMLAFVGSTVFSLVTILVLAVLERRGRGSPEGRLGTGYVVAAALSIILLSKNRYAEAGWLDLLKGEIITISNSDLALTAI